jgi:hypothetical protein
VARHGANLCATPAEPRVAASAALGYLLTAAFVVGLALFVRDCVALRRCLRSWHARSRCGEHLRALLPRELAAVAAKIRIVEGSAVAAASGVLEATVWLGDRHTEAQLKLSLVHELWHVRARDPAWVGLIAAVRRAYWWNPLVAYLARQAVLMIESTCDHRCAAELGKAHYVSQLATLLLAATAPAPRLVATIGTANADVQRLRLLGQPLRVRARDLGLLVALTASGTAAAAIAVVERSAPVAEAAPLGIDLPAAGRQRARCVAAPRTRATPLCSPSSSARTRTGVAATLRTLRRGAGRRRAAQRAAAIEYVVESRGAARDMSGRSRSPTPLPTITELNTKLLAW